MVEVEENCEKHGKGNSQEDIAYANIPEVYQPWTIKRREKGFTRRKSSDVDISHMTDVNEPSEKDDGQGCSIVFDEFANISLEKVAISQLTADPAYN